MSKHVRLRIHIAPLGFESDRVVLPAIEMKADKVWILTHNDPKKTDAKSYLDDIKTRLRKARIDFEIMRLNRLNLSSTIKGVRTIMSKGEDDTYYVNVSSGSKIQAVACTMACMIFLSRLVNLACSWLSFLAPILIISFFSASTAKLLLVILLPFVFIICKDCTSLSSGVLISYCGT